MSIMGEAFVGAPLSLQGSFKRFAAPAATPRRTRTYAVSPRARSLDSYRDGKHYKQEQEARRVRNRRRRESDSLPLPGPAQEPASTPRVKQRVALTSALVSLRIASIETCGFLVRSGCVRVNGQTECNDKAKINRFDDILSVNAKEYGTLANALEKLEALSHSDRADEIDRSMLPKTQRDFRPSETNSLNTTPVKKYNRHVDRGFYSSRRHQSGK